VGQEEHTHEGSFAEGQEAEEHHPERDRRGEFAEGLEEDEHAHEGSFAAGQQARERHPEDEPKGRFSRRKREG
jgi:hypothetical protein